MADETIRARVVDLIGDDPWAVPTVVRVPAQEAAQTCRPLQVVAATDAGGRDVVVVALDKERVYVLPDSCPHAGARLSEGFVDKGRLVCPYHGWEFDLEAGTCPMRPGVTVDSKRVGLGGQVPD